MKRARGAIILFLVLAVVVALAVSRNAAEGTSESFASSYDNGAYGLLALHDVLQSRGIRVERFEHPFGLLPKDGTLVLATTKYEVDSPNVVAQAIDASDEKAVRAFAERGGHVVVLGTDAYFDFSKATHVNAESATKPGTSAVRVLDVEQTAGVDRVEGPFSLLTPYRVLVAAYPLLGTPDGAFAYTVPVGKGDITVIDSENVFDNAHLARADNMAFAYNLLSRGGPVYFDEYLHGYDSGKTFWRALPEPVHVAVYIVGVAIVLFLIGANVRFAPSLPLDPPDERDSSAYLASMGRLLRRARAGRAAIARFADDAARMLRSRERAEAQDWMNELRRLSALDRPTAGDVRRAATLHALIRKDAS